MTPAHLWEFYVSWLLGSDALEPEQEFRGWCKRLAWLARYGKIPPSESARYPVSVLDGIERAMVELIEEEKPDPSSDL